MIKNHKNPFFYTQRRPVTEIVYVWYRLAKKEMWMDEGFPIFKSIWDHHHKIKLPIIVPCAAIMSTNLSSNLAIINETVTKTTNHVNCHKDANAVTNPGITDLVNNHNKPGVLVTHVNGNTILIAEFNNSDATESKLLAITTNEAPEIEKNKIT